jgi:site-specific DNA recombinase
VYWVCRRHDEAAAKCAVRQIEEQTLEEVSLYLYYNLKHYGPEILAQLIADLRSIKGGSLLWSEGIVEINKQISDIACQERLLAQLKQQGVVDPDIFISRADLLAERRRELKRKKERIIQTEEDDTIQKTEQMLDTLESGPDWLETFDEAIFNELVEKIVVLDNETLHFRLLNGLEIPEKIERTRR